MVVRHCVEATNVNEDSFVINPSQIRHVTVKAGKIEEMSGLIDPDTHLNLDFDSHKVDACIIAERLERGAKVRFSDQGLEFAFVPRTAFKHFGFVDYTQRLLAMKESVKKIREEKTRSQMLG